MGTQTEQPALATKRLQGRFTDLEKRVQKLEGAKQQSKGAGPEAADLCLKNCPEPANPKYSSFELGYLEGIKQAEAKTNPDIVQDLDKCPFCGAVVRETWGPGMNLFSCGSTTKSAYELRPQECQHRCEAIAETEVRVRKEYSIKLGLILDTASFDINTSNYTHDDVCNLDSEYSHIYGEVVELIREGDA